MKRTLGRWLLITSLVAFVAAGVPTVAFADIEGPTDAENIEEGDNGSDTGQAGESASGDAVAGQVTGVVTGGQTSVDATNESRDVDVASGDTEGSNESSSLVGQSGSSSGTVIGTDITNVSAQNVQEGHNDLDVMQTTSVSSGDAVGGQVIGVVTSAGGSTDIVAANTSEDVNVETGDATANNELATLVGQDCSANPVIAADITLVDGACNVQEGDNEESADQSATASTGDGVAGQVLGTVSAGDTSIDATNSSEDVDLSSGDADAANEAANAIGHTCPGSLTVEVTDVTTVGACSAQEGDNEGDLNQSADASSGDAVGGEVIGAVTSAGGSTDIVAANTSEDVDVDTGDADAANDLTALVGHVCASSVAVTSDVIDVGACSAQDGDNDLASNQEAAASTGDGVGGQVLGVVSSGDTSIDATNSSQDVDLETGDADSANELAALVGHDCNNITEVTASDVIDTSVCSAQDGDNDAELGQTADASSGDAVGGEVIGAVTAAGGSTDIVAANSSEDVDVETGDAAAANDQAGFVGFNCGQALAVTADVINSSNACDAQDGDNELADEQSATAATGDGVGGQVLGAVSAGDTSIDATNSSQDVDLSTGDADATNELSAFVGHDCIGGLTTVGPGAADVINVSACGAQDGDDSADLGQAADASSGDAVGGEVIGAVTAAGGSADIVAANSSSNVDVDTGDATADNDLAGIVGHVCSSDDVIVAADAIDIDACNAQDGDNDLTADQGADASTGDGVGGQVLGVVSSGDTSVDATNSSEDVDLETGDADSSNELSVLVGLVEAQSGSDVIVGAADVSCNACANAQDGDNEGDFNQTATASSGDAVGGQVGGVVTSAGGSADLVLSNTSLDVDGETGDSDFANVDEAFIGQVVAGSVTV